MLKRFIQAACSFFHRPKQRAYDILARSPIDPLSIPAFKRTPPTSSRRATPAA